jgi:hypothetical protein
MSETFVVSSGVLGYRVTCTECEALKKWSLTETGARSLGLAHADTAHPKPTTPGRFQLSLTYRLVGTGVVASCTCGEWVGRAFNDEGAAWAGWGEHSLHAHRLRGAHQTAAS